MSEPSEAKTKRRYSAVLRGHRWSHQHSVFYDNSEESHALREHMVKFKQALRRKHPDKPFLIRIQTLKKGGGPLQAYLTIFTTAKVADLQEIVDKTFPTQMNTMGKKLKEEKIQKIAATIEREKPHDLSKMFFKSGVNRWSVLNKELLAHIRKADDGN